MLTFNEFINESLKLILESNVSFSDKFINILKNIKHPIAEKILDLHNSDLPVTNNFFEINPKDNSKVFFIPDRKAQQIISKEGKYVTFTGSNGGWLRHSINNKRIFDELGYKPEGTAYVPNSVEIGEVLNKYKSSTSGKMYYYVKFNNGSGVYNIEKLKEITDISKKLFSMAKQELNVGRAMRALLTSAKVEFTNKELEDFVNEYKSSLDLYGGIFSDFELVTGDEIKHWYLVDNYAKNHGTLGSSCMRYSESQDYFDIYTENPDVCSLLILKDKDNPNKIIARALLWTTREGNKFLDRIYTINDSDVNIFKEYAKTNGWYSKFINNSTSSNYVDLPDGSGRNTINLTVDVRHSSYGQYPYLDTLKYFSTESNSLSTQNSGGAYLLEDTEGGYVFCEYCDGRGEVDCGDCNGDGEVDCYVCSGNGTEGCYNCDGSGEITDSDEKLIPCPACDGDGEVECSECGGLSTEDCSNCGGSGLSDCYDCS